MSKQEIPERQLIQVGRRIQRGGKSTQKELRKIVDFFFSFLNVGVNECIYSYKTLIRWLHSYQNRWNERKLTFIIAYYVPNTILFGLCILLHLFLTAILGKVITIISFFKDETETNIAYISFPRFYSKLHSLYNSMSLQL